jgi:hypothetical protein
MSKKLIVAGMLFLIFCLSAQAQTPPKKITVTGKLTRVMAIGGESTGWAVQFDAPTAVGDKPASSIEVSFSDPKQAEQYLDKRVKVTGTITHRHGVETGDAVILEVISIKGAKPPKSTVK